MKKYAKEDQAQLATWSIGCAERALPLFEQVAADDGRPRTALEIGREWVRTRLFRMSIIRGASLAAHAAAKDTMVHPAASLAAHACGQAVATAHVAQHAYGGAYYALKALVASDPKGAPQLVADELAWQAEQLPPHLREEIMSRIIVENRSKGPSISIRKGPGF